MAKSMNTMPHMVMTP